MPEGALSSGERIPFAVRKASFRKTGKPALQKGGIYSVKSWVSIDEMAGFLLSGHGVPFIIPLPPFRRSSASLSVFLLLPFIVALLPSCPFIAFLSSACCSFPVLLLQLSHSPDVSHSIIAWMFFSIAWTYFSLAGGPFRLFGGILLRVFRRPDDSGKDAEY